jgi:hypothetical protein
LSEQLVAGARRRLNELSSKKRKNPQHSHLRRFCSDAIDIIREVDPTIGARGKRVEHYMRQLFKHLPDSVLLPGQRPRPSGEEKQDAELIENALKAFAKQAKRASTSEERLKGGARPMSRTKARTEAAARSRSDCADTHLDQIISAALAEHVADIPREIRGKRKMRD